jgi:O-antigen/teichoic acid export membrane protein
VTFAAFVPFFTLLAGTLRSVFQVNYVMHYVFIAEVTQRVITTAILGFIVFLGVRGSDNVNLYYFCILTGGIGAFILLIISYVSALQFMRIYPVWHGRTIRHLLKSAIPFGVAYLLISVCRQFDTTMISLLRDDFQTQNAYYGFVLRMGDVAFLIPTFLLNSTLPIVSERRERGEEVGTILGKTFIVLLIFGSTSFLFAFLWPRPLISLLTTPQYLSTLHHPGSDTALSLMSIPMFLNGMILFSFYVFLIRGAWKRLAVTLLFGAAASIGGNLLLIPLFGFVGSAITAVLVYSLLTFFLLSQVFATTAIRFPHRAFSRWAVFCLLLGSILWFSRPLLTSDVIVFFGLGMMAAILCVLLWITGILRLFLRLPRISFP